MSAEGWVSILFGVAGIAGAVFAYLAWRSTQHSNQIASRSLEVAEEALDLNKDQAAMQPELVAHAKFEAELSPNRTGPYTGTLTVRLANVGRIAANNIQGWIHFEAEKLEPYKIPESTHDRYGLPVLTIPGPKLSFGSSCLENQEPINGFYRARAWEKEQLLPQTLRDYEFSVTIKDFGEAEISCRFVSAGGAEVENTQSIQIRRPEGS